MRCTCFRVFYLLLIIFSPRATLAFDGFSEKEQKFITYASQGNVAELKKIRGLHPYAMTKSLYKAVSPCFANTVSHLLGRGYTFSQNDLGVALHLASREGEAHCVALLLKIGAPINFVYGDTTPLAAAKQRDHFEVVGLLIAKGAQLEKLQPFVTFSPSTGAISLTIPFGYWVAATAFGVWVAGTALYKTCRGHSSTPARGRRLTEPPAEGAAGRGRR